MNTGNWMEIRLKLQKTLKEIFHNYNIEKLSDFEKRKIIFEYLCNNLSYDFVLLENIKNFNERKQKISRNPYLELFNVINDRKGICNAISQYYKLLLEEVGIISYCVICNDGTSVEHQLNLVYDNKQKTYSFDDITSVIVGRGTIEDYFDYNLEFANYVNQGNKEILEGNKWIILPEEYINYLVGKEITLVPPLNDLPSNIVCTEQKYNLKR